METEVFSLVREVSLLRPLALEFEKSNVKLVELGFEPRPRLGADILHRHQPDWRRLWHMGPAIPHGLESDTRLFQLHFN
jgi:hypothetical protein